MDARRGWAWMAMLLLGISAAVPGAARAQEPLRGVWPDSLGVATDTVRVPVERLSGLGRCGITGHAVVRDEAELARLRRYPQCREARFPSLAGRTLVGLSIFGDCHALFRVEAFRSESRRELRVRVWGRYGGCRAGAFRDVWISLPAVPPGWAVRFTDAAAPEDTPRFGPDWEPVRAPDDDGVR